MAEQPISGLGPLGRKLSVRRRGRRSLAAVRTHFLATSRIPLATDFLAAANAQLGKPYSATISCRCSNQCPKQDCSGLVCGSYNAVTGGSLCTSSFGLAQMGKNAGLLISEAEAIVTPGALGIENPWGTPTTNGANGHVVIFEGDGKTTIEEFDTAEGCIHGAATGRGFSAWMRMPGLNYDTQEEDVLTFVCPNKPKKNGNTPVAQFVAAGPIYQFGAIILRWGASIAQDQPTSDPNVRLLVHNGPQKWLSACAAKDGGGLVITNDAGTTPEVYWS